MRCYINILTVGFCLGLDKLYLNCNIETSPCRRLMATSGAVKPHKCPWAGLCEDGERERARERAREVGEIKR